MLTWQGYLITSSSLVLHVEATCLTVNVYPRPDAPDERTDSCHSDNDNDDDNYDDDAILLLKRKSST